MSCVFEFNLFCVVNQIFFIVIFSKCVVYPPLNRVLISLDIQFIRCFTMAEETA